MFSTRTEKLTVKISFKNDDPIDPKHYRPNSITCAISKTFEKVFHAQITEHLDKHQITSPFQVGFRTEF